MKVVLNDHVSWSFHINVLVFQVLEFTLFLFFINNLFNVISSQLGICTNDTIIYSCLNSKSDRYDKVKPTVTLENDLQLVVNCAKKLFNFNVYQTKLLFFFFNCLRETFCLPLTWLMLTWRIVIHCTFLISCFPLAWSEVIILNQLLGLQLAMLVYCVMLDNLSCQNPFYTFIKLSIVFALNIAAISGLVLLLYIKILDKVQRFCNVISPDLASSVTFPLPLCGISLSFL